jgi:hypothetical protein
LTENPDLPNNHLIGIEAHFHLHDTVNKLNFRYWSAANSHELHHCPLYDPKFLFGVLLGPEESLDPTSLRVKADKPSQSYHNATKR